MPGTQLFPSLQAKKCGTSSSLLQCLSLLLDSAIAFDLVGSIHHLLQEHCQILSIICNFILLGHWEHFFFSFFLMFFLLAAPLVVSWWQVDESCSKKRTRTQIGVRGGGGGRGRRAKSWDATCLPASFDCISSAFKCTLWSIPFSICGTFSNLYIHLLYL